MTSEKIVNDNTKAFLDYVAAWYDGLAPMEINRIQPEPEKLAVISVDVTNGFCYEGALASSRVAGIVEPIARLFRRAEGYGCRHFILSQDTHPPDSVEFSSYPPHCLQGSREAETVNAFKALPFFDRFITYQKNSISSNLGTPLDAYLLSHGEIDTFLAVGDCTDLCTYQLAMYLKLRGNASNMPVKVVVPEDCTQTYDTPVAVAQSIGALPHDGDLLHVIFLYHMMLNGIEIVKTVI